VRASKVASLAAGVETRESEYKSDQKQTAVRPARNSISFRAARQIERANSTHSLDSKIKRRAKAKEIFYLFSPCWVCVDSLHLPLRSPCNKTGARVEAKDTE
jgi:hypothetical protein